MFTVSLPDNIAQQILDRLAFIKIHPKVLLFSGLIPPWLIKKISSLYREASALHLSSAHSSPQTIPSSKNDSSVKSISLASEATDIIFANHFAPEDWPELFKAWQHWLKIDGLLMFATLGVDTLKELRQFDLSLPVFPDMHDLGDLLSSLSFKGIVMDMETITISFKHFKKLLKTQPGFLNFSAELLEKISTLNLSRNFSLSFEIIYGHAWKGKTSQYYASAEEVLIPISNLVTAKKYSK